MFAWLLQNYFHVHRSISLFTTFIYHLKKWCLTCIGQLINIGWMMKKILLIQWNGNYCLIFRWENQILLFFKYAFSWVKKGRKSTVLVTLLHTWPICNCFRHFKQNYHFNSMILILPGPRNYSCFRDPRKFQAWSNIIGCMSAMKHSPVLYREKKIYQEDHENQGIPLK